MALVVMMALTISTAGLMTYVSSNEHSYARDSYSARALGIAEAGLQSAAGVVATQDPTNQVAVGTRLPAAGPPQNPPTTYSQSIDGGTATYYIQKTASKLWVAYATGVSAGGSAGSVTRQVQANIQDVPVQTPNSDIWNHKFFIATTPGVGCTSVAGSVNVTGSVWIGGDFCPNGGASIADPAVGGGTVDVYIGGVFNPSNNAKIGANGTPVKSATIVGGCINVPTKVCSNPTTSQVYANSYGSTVSSESKPPLTAADIYPKGAWNSPVCSTSPPAGSYVFDGVPAGSPAGASATVADQSLGTVATWPYSFNCSVYKPGVTPSPSSFIGSLAYNTATSTLTINGGVIIDGNLSLTGKMQYQGSGTLYVNGTVAMSSGTLCGAPATIPSSGNTCIGSWSPSTANMCIVALNPANAATAFNVGSNYEADISVWANGQLSQSGSSSVLGPEIADSAQLRGGSTTVAPATPPPYAPQAPSDNWTLQPGSWRQVR